MKAFKNSQLKIDLKENFNIWKFLGDFS